MKATDIQVGGSHYKDMVMQPIELITAIRCSFIQGCIIKYVSRYKAKNGIEDIKKCIHYAQLALELNDKRKCRPDKIHYTLSKYARKNNLSKSQTAIISSTIHNNYERVVNLCYDLIYEECPDNPMEWKFQEKAADTKILLK